jgi:hypothetical protein
MWEKASPAKKTTRSSLVFFVFKRRAFNLVLPRNFFCFQVCSKLRSVRLLHHHLRQNFCTWLCIHLIRMILRGNFGSIVLPHLHHRVRINPTHGIGFNTYSANSIISGRPTISEFLFRRRRKHSWCSTRLLCRIIISEPSSSSQEKI